MEAPHTGGSYGGSRQSGTGLDKPLTRGAQEVINALYRGLGTFTRLEGTSPSGRAFLLPLSGVGQGDAYSDLHITMITNGDTLGATTRQRTVFPVREEFQSTHWKVLERIQSDHREHAATPFVVLGRGEFSEYLGNGEKAVAPNFGKSQIECLGIKYPANSQVCNEWSKNLLNVVSSIELEHGIRIEDTLKPDEAGLIRDIRRSIRETAHDEDGGARLNSLVLRHLVDYTDRFGARANPEEVPKFIRDAVEKKRAEEI